MSDYPWGGELAGLTDEPQRVDDGLCDTCWGSGWEAQFVTPCPDCKGTGRQP